MKQALIHKQRIPYGGQYILDNKDAGMVGQGGNFENLEASVRRYRIANAIPIGIGFVEELEDEVCRKYPQECKNCDPNLPRRKQISWRDVVAGTTVMANLWKTKVSNAVGLTDTPVIVSQDEADRRAALCAKCPWKIETVFPCGGLCGELEKVVKAAVGAQRTASNAEIANKSCEVCSCYIAASVWLPLEIQCVAVEGRVREKFQAVRALYPCWKNCDSL